MLTAKQVSAQSVHAAFLNSLFSAAEVARQAYDLTVLRIAELNRLAANAVDENARGELEVEIVSAEEISEETFLVAAEAKIVWKKAYLAARKKS